MRASTRPRVQTRRGHAEALGSSADQYDGLTHAIRAPALARPRLRARRTAFSTLTGLQPVAHSKQYCLRVVSVGRPQPWAHIFTTCPALWPVP